MEKKLVIIDGSSLLYRAFYALPPTMTSPDGIPTNAVYGFLRMLLGLYRDPVSYTHLTLPTIRLV